ncbi:MAG: ATP-binding cassette domain-containing protein [Gemmatimonadota bacterium]
MASDWGGIRVDVRVPLDGRALSLVLETRASSVAVVGPSGAGKSTLLRILAGVHRRSTGLVEVDGAVWQDEARGMVVPPWERRVGWVPQDMLLFPHLSVRENLGYAGAGMAAVEEIADVLQVSHLLGRRPRRLSGGERQRVALGRALLSRPALLLLDEPFSALDRPLRAQLTAMVKAWARERAVPLVLVSHDEEDAAVLAGERWHLADGVLGRIA